jgi:hypothetical protein
MSDQEVGQDSLRALGRSEFDKAHFQAFWEEIGAVISNRSVGLLNFDEIKAKLHLRDQTYRGLQEIAIERIVGSVGRNREFTKRFLPKNPETASRWSNVYAVMNGLTGVPPIDVFQVDDVYFVRDGNHRVSIARQMGLKTIEAYVTEMHTPIDLEPNMTKKELAAAEAYATFLKMTRLDYARPNQEQITLTHPHHYQSLHEHIQIVQQMMEVRREGEAVPIEQAAVQWYDTVYAPCIALIRKYDVLEQFPRKTEGDLYIWVIDHFLYLWETYGSDARPLTLSTALVDMFAAHKIPVPKRLLKEDDDPLV